jgi:hypothetical protein
MKAELQELEEWAAELQATARQLQPGPDPHDLLQEVGRFRAQVAALQANLLPTLEAEGEQNQRQAWPA